MLLLQEIRTLFIVLVVYFLLHHCKTEIYIDFKDVKNGLNQVKLKTRVESPTKHDMKETCLLCLLPLRHKTEASG